jgi:ABC-type uncharacterized transport system involved in gliding motility auxiliary subunit
MKRDLRPLALPAYGLGLVALLATAGWYAVNRAFDVYVRIGLIVAVLAVAAGILVDPERVRRALTGRQARYGSNALLISLAFLGILVVVNYLAYANPVRSDLTEDQEFTLTPETLLTISRLPGPVVVKGFYSPELESSRQTAQRLFDQYRIHSDGKLSYEFIDPYENPVAANDLGVTRDGSVVVIYGEASEVVLFPDEQGITSALVHLANPEARKVYFLTGHGEMDSEGVDDYGLSQLRQALESKNYEVGTVNLLVDSAVPEDALAVVMAGSTHPVSEEEAALLQEYVEAGGALVVLMQPRAETEFGTADDPLAAYLSETWGIGIDDDLVVEPNSSNFLVAVSFRYGSHAITERLGNLASVFPAACSLTLSPDPDGRRSLTGLVFTSDNAWGETDLGFLDTQDLPEFTEGADPEGSLALAVAGESTSVEGRVAVICDADFATNAIFTQLANGDLVVNTVDWAAGQEGLIDLTPKPSTSRYVVPPSVQATGLIILTTVVLLPGAVVVLGVYVWWSRRRRV